MQVLDPYQDGRSLVHHLDARIKLVLVAAYILTAALTPNAAWPVYVLLAALGIAAELASELGLGFYFKRALLAVPFVLAALPLLISVPGPALLHLPFGWTVSTAGLARFISVALKSWLSVQMAVLLAATTPFPAILMAMRALKLPRLLVAIIGLMWRYLFVMVDEAQRLMRARQSRSGESAEGTATAVPSEAEAGAPASAAQRVKRKVGGSLVWRARVTGGMAGSLFIRSLERSDRIYNAMLARGYDGEIRALPQPGITLPGWITLGVGLLLLLGLLGLGALLR